MLKHIPPVGSAAGQSQQSQQQSQQQQRTQAATPTVAPPLIATSTSQSVPARPSRSHLNRSHQPLNVSTLSTATLNGGIGSSSLLQTHNHSHSHLHHHHPPHISTTPHTPHNLSISFQPQASQHTKLLNGNPPRMSSFPTPLPSLSSSNQLLVNNSSSSINNNQQNYDQTGAREALTSLGLLCLGEMVIS